MPAGQASVQTVVTTSDTTLKSTPGYIHWITLSNSHATDSTAVELDNGGTDVWGVLLEAVDLAGIPFHATFDPPIFCDTSIIIDISNGTVKATVGFS